jgi:uncharacterized protein YkwD
MHACALVWMIVLAPPVGQDQVIAVEMHSEAQRLRKQYSLKPQKLDKKCCEIAQKWAEHMAATHSMYHGDGEQIIAAGYKDVKSAFGGWMSSSGHRYWVLSGSDLAGWGAAKSSTGRWYWAGAFRSSAKKKVEATTYYYTPSRRFRLLRRR